MRPQATPHPRVFIQIDTTRAWVHRSRAAFAVPGEDHLLARFGQARAGLLGAEVRPPRARDRHQPNHFPPNVDARDLNQFRLVPEFSSAGFPRGFASVTNLDNGLVWSRFPWSEPKNLSWSKQYTPSVSRWTACELEFSDARREAIADQADPPRSTGAPGGLRPSFDEVGFLA